jgi:Peptidase family M1 domain/Secretion system C-terminal sorting domain
MTKHLFKMLVCINCIPLFLQAQPTQNTSPYYHSLRRSPATPDIDPDPNSSGQSGTGANYDVKYHKVFWRINPDSSVKYIRGFVQTNFRTIAGSVSALSFDINSVLIVDSVRFRGARLPAININRSGNIMTIDLGAILANNTLDSIWIYYRGTPPAVSGAAEGYQVRTDPTTNQRYIYTLSESYEDRDWWPCKADMQDKIDSMDITVSVPWTGADTFWVATNGRLVDSTISSGNRFFTYKTRYPMASYLVSVAVARFNRYYYPNVTVGGASVPVVFYLHRGKSAANYNTILTAMSRQTQVLTAFSTRFGDYPFKREKHGFYEGLGGAGGMEHQTFSAMSGGSTAGGIGSLASATTLAHELIHQWFGDKVTFATWADLWLAEGFARYGEALAGEFVPATGINPATEMAAAKSAARSITTTPARITSFATSNQVWTSANISAVYDRGCMVISMLRALSGDTRFFQACTNYLDSLNGSGYKSANTDSLKNNFNRVLNYDLTPFFNDFVIGVGHPTTLVNWNSPAANRLVVSVASQTRSAGATATYFHNVIVLRVQGALVGQDTTIVFYDIDGNNLAKAGNGIAAATPGNLLTYNLSFTPTTVTFDPFSVTMSAGSTVRITTLDLKIVDFTARNRGSYNEAILTLDDNSINSAILLERSGNGVEFSETGTMNLLPVTGVNKTYQYKDFAPLNGNNYYRAKFKNADGDYIYSKVIKIVGGSKNSFSVINNPATGGVLLVSSDKNSDNRALYQFRIYDASGKLVSSEDRKLTGSIIRLGISKLAAGTYVLKISGNEVAELMRFVVE